MFKVGKLIKAVIFIALFALLINSKSVLKSFFPDSYRDYVYKYSENYNVNPNLIFGIIKAESNFAPNVVSPKKAFGLMQITEPTAAWIAGKLNNAELAKRTDEPEINIMMGTYYISYLLDMYDGNEKSALAAYNAGFNVVDRWLLDEKYSQDGKNLSKIPYKETESYVVKVQNSKRIYRILYDSE